MRQPSQSVNVPDVRLAGGEAIGDKVIAQFVFKIQYTAARG